MEQYLARFLGALAEEKHYSVNTISAYRNDLSQFLDFVRARTGTLSEPEALNRELIEAYVDDMQGGSVGYAPSTVARKVAAVKSFFHFLLEQRVIGADPASKLRSPKVKKAIPKSLSTAEMERLLAAPGRLAGPKAQRDRALLELLYATGMRVTEVVNLQVDDVDWEQGTLECQTKGERRRRIPLGSARGPLTEYWQSARPSLARDDSPGTLFLNHRGKKLTRQGVWLILKEAAQAAGIGSEVTPHTLRHSFALNLLGQGQELRRVQELLGHANLSTTQVYRHTESEEPAKS